MILKVFLTGASVCYIYCFYGYYRLRNQIQFYEAFEKSPIIDFDTFDLQELKTPSIILHATTNEFRIFKSKVSNEQIIFSLAGFKTQNSIPL